MVQKTRVIKKCFQFSSEGGERRCSPYGWRQTVSVSRLWSGDREWSVAQGWSPDRRDNQSCCGWRARVTAALDVSYPADTVSEVGRSCAEHRGGTVSALVRTTGGDRAGEAWCVQNASMRRQVVRRRWGQTEVCPESDQKRRPALSSSSQPCW